MPPNLSRGGSLVGFEQPIVFSGGHTYDGKSIFYAVDAAQNLRWYGAAINRSTGGVTWDANSGTVILDAHSQSPPGLAVGSPIKTALYGGDGVIYVIRRDGTLQWYRDLLRTGDTSGAYQLWADNSGRFSIGTGWNSVLATADQDDTTHASEPTGILYAINTQVGSPAYGNLYWYRFLDPYYGTNAGWAANTGNSIGNGWAQFDFMFSGGSTTGTNAILYVIDHAGHLKWYRDDGYAGSGYHWAALSGVNAIGSGWSNFSRGTESQRMYLENWWTQIPTDSYNLTWSSGRDAQLSSIADAVSTGANVLVMSDWDVDGPTKGGPMKPSFPADYDAVFEAVDEIRNAGTEVRVLPAIEGVDGEPAVSLRDIPIDPTKTWLHDRVLRLVQEFLENYAHPEWRDDWQQIYDQRGYARYAINLLHVSSRFINDDPTKRAETATNLAAALQEVADEIYSNTNHTVLVGFTIDPWKLTDVAADPQIAQGRQYYTPSPAEADYLTSDNYPAVLGVQAFNPEISIGGTDPQSEDALNACYTEISSLRRKSGRVIRDGDREGRRSNEVSAARRSPRDPGRSLGLRAA